MPVCRDVDQLFDVDFLRRLDALSLAARQLVRGRMKAERRSNRHGASVEFAEYRPFNEGDDFRYIDWNAYARWRQLVLKLFVEEEDLHVYLLVDATPSMDWGSPNKFDQARKLAAGLAYLGLANLDRVGLVFTGGDQSTRFPVSRGRNRFLSMLRFMAEAEIAPEPLSLEQSVSRWLASKPRRGLVIAIGDCWGSDRKDAFEALNRLRYARHELAMIQMMAHEETTAGDFGEYELVESDYGGREKVIVDPSMVRDYKENFEAYQLELKSYCQQYRISLLQTDTRLPVEELLLRTLRHGGFIR